MANYIRVSRLVAEVMSPQTYCQCWDGTTPPPATSSKSSTVIIQATGIVECRLTNVPRLKTSIGANSRVVGRLSNA